MTLRETVQVYERNEILNMSSCLWGAESEKKKNPVKGESFFSELFFFLFPIFVVVIGH